MSSDVDIGLVFDVFPLLGWFGSSRVSVWEEILNAIKSDIDDLIDDGSLPACITPNGTDTLSTVLRKIPVDQNLGFAKDLTLPACIICPQKKVIVNRVMGKNDVVYGTWIVLVAADNRERTIAQNLGTFLLWTEVLTNHFHAQRLTGVSSVMVGMIENGEFTIADAWKDGLWAAAALLRHTSREART